MTKEPPAEETEPDHAAYICLGSNLGDRAAFLDRALAGLRADIGIRVTATSQVLENPPLLFRDQGDFLNQIAAITTRYPPETLLERLKELEYAVGRRPTFRNGPREIDLDILAFEGSVLQTSVLVLPHPGLLARPFLRTLLGQLGTTPEKLEQGRFE